MTIKKVESEVTKMPKGRVFNIMQYKKHPETGEVLLTEDTIEKALQHKTIKQWAYTNHDQDVYSAADEEADPNHKQGQKKEEHWHIVINSSNALEVSVIAKWFGIPENYVDIPKGYGAGKFIDCVEYLTHESARQQELGKHRYPDEQIRANFDWREKLDKRNENKIKYGRDLTEEDQMLYDVMYLGKSLRQCEKEDPLIYMEKIDKLCKLRLEYIKRQAPPMMRINYYIYGKGGVGKDLMSRALARALFPEYENDDDIYFIVGAGNVTFEGYDGQPVLIWSDSRSLSLVKKLGGRENFFNVFDTHPAKQRQNVKFGSVNLCNVVNIVNGQESYEEFLDNIVKEKNEDGDWVVKEDKGQSYRRFPFIIPLHDEDFDLMINKGFFDNDGSLFTEYYMYNHIRGNMQKIMIACGGEQAPRAREVATKVVKPITDKHAEVLTKMNTEADEEAIAQILADTEQPMPKRLIKHTDGTVTDEQGFMEVDESILEELPFE